MKKIIQWVFVMVFLVSCSANRQKDTPSPNPIDTNIPTPTNNISSKTIIPPTISNTPSLVPTRTMMPTSNPTLLTQEAVISSCAAKERVWYTKHLSTKYTVNGQWGVVICSDNGIYTKVVNETLNILWEIPAVYDNSIPPVPTWYWKPYLWSPDGRYLYMEPICLCSIDSPWLIYASGYGLSRLNLNSGRLDVWLTPSDNPWYTFAFSDDVKLFAYTPPDFYGTIKVRNLATGEERNINFKEKYNILEYRWTPDNSRLVVFTEEYVNDPSENGFSVFVYSLKSETLIKLMDKNNLNFTFPTEEHMEPRIAISDLTNHVLKLSDVYGENEFQINIRSGELSSGLEVATPTP
jgi:hypothetical protein